jgi:hypothetical protein
VSYISRLHAENEIQRKLAFCILSTRFEDVYLGLVPEVLGTKRPLNTDCFVAYTVRNCATAQLGLEPFLDVV